MLQSKIENSRFLDGSSGPKSVDLSRSRVGFDWDKDQEGLVTASASPASRAVLNPDARPSAWRGKLGLFVLGLSIALGAAYEKDLFPQVGTGAAMGLFLADMPAMVVDADVLPAGLLVYDDAQALAYLRGLRRADRPTLETYLVRMSADLSRASPAMVPFYKDAQALLNSELARRSPSAS